MQALAQDQYERALDRLYGALVDGFSKGIANAIERLEATLLVYGKALGVSSEPVSIDLLVGQLAAEADARLAETVGGIAY